VGSRIPAKDFSMTSRSPVVNRPLEEALARLSAGRHHDPFELLGRHAEGDNVTIRVFLPRARRVQLPDLGRTLARIPHTDVFQWSGPADQVPVHYRVAWTDEYGHRHTRHDPYSFPPQLSYFDLHLFSEGRHWNAYRFLGARIHDVDSVSGVLFAVWAPNADRVSVIGDFNRWDGRAHPMRIRGESGVWELFIPDLAPGAVYKYEILSRDGSIQEKADPYGNHFELRPSNASIVDRACEYAWGDDAWIESRARRDWQHAPMSVYEVHLGSWRRGPHGSFLNYRNLAHQLADYVNDLGFTHIELLPITEHPFDGSWGYQTTGYFAPTSRFGTPDDFRYFVDYLHQRGIGVILDWVPAHFPKDRHALAWFDGTALYEHQDPRRGEHRDWGTLIFNYGRVEVKNFLLASAVYWLEEFHLDGLRVDAVASMLYLDYSRAPGDWVPNRYGGRENLEAVDFLRELNAVTHERFPGTLTIAEESTAWPQVSRPTWLGGLGFSMKWNMGWMHDSLSYLEKDPIHRHYHHDLLTFGMIYSFSENFVLPFSHDEVVHGKRSMLDKMPGDAWQRFANLRLLYTYMFSYPGKKLLFMGSEFAQGLEWSEARELDWNLLERPQHQGVQRLLADLNRIYTTSPALHASEFDQSGFEWIDCHDSSQSVLSYLRMDSDGALVVVALNFTPVPRDGYRIGVPKPGYYREVFNSDSEYYGGSNFGSFPGRLSENREWNGRPHSLVLDLPPLGGLLLRWEPASFEATGSAG